MIAVDCIGEILKFFAEDGEEVNKFILLSKGVRRYIREENPNVCSRVEFVIRTTPTVSIPYCHNLKAKSFIGSGLKTYPDLKPDFLKYFPNLKTLELNDVGNKIQSSDSIFKYLVSNHLGKLYLTLMPFTDLRPPDEDFDKFDGLKRLYVSCCVDLDGSFLRHKCFKNLEELEIPNMSQVEEHSISELKNLKKLVIFNHQRFTGKCLKHLTSLEAIDLKALDQLEHMECRSLKNLKNLKSVKLDDCGIFIDIAMIKVCLNEGVELEFKKAVLMLPGAPMPRIVEVEEPIPTPI